STATLSSPESLDSNQRRNSPVQQFNDNLSWTRGKHNFNFGAAYNKATSFFQSSGGPLVPEANFDVVAADPANTGANAIFSGANFPLVDANGKVTAADATTIANARRIYALLTGRISQYTFNAKLD